MITKVRITDRENSPIHYINELRGFENGKEYEFSPGVNIIVGENGSGKTTLINLIRKYTLIRARSCECNIYNFNELVNFSDKFLDGIDVYGDWKKNIFSLQTGEESRLNDTSLDNFSSFGLTFESMHSSTGQGTLAALSSLFEYMFDPNTELSFPIDEIRRRVKDSNERLKEETNNWRIYQEYIDNHTVDCPSRYTLLMDEPDKNLDIFNIEQLLSILEYERDDLQLITTIHNPLILYKISNNRNINFIEMSTDYIKKVKEKVEHLIDD
jgi:predicted ATPase